MIRPMKKTSRSIGVTGGLVLAWLVGSSGCSTQFLSNQTQEITGNITVLVINNTPYRASFSIATWDALDLIPPGPIDFQQFRIEANTTNPLITLTCHRNAAIGTQDLIDRALATNADAAGGFDPDAFTTDVNFSSAPADSAAAALPTVGTAKDGIGVRLGVEYNCGDELIFSFQQDPTAPGGFRIDFNVLRAPPPNE